MEKIKMIVARFLIVLAGLLWLPLSIGEAATMKLACNANTTIGNALKKLKPGDTLSVTGNCKENVTIPEETVRVVLDGQGKATISGPDASKPTIEVRGRGITIKGFTIAGGRDGINVTRGGQAVVDGNTIQGAARFGIDVAQHSAAVIANNAVQNNAANGIMIGGNSFAFVGFLSGLDKTASPNIIENNGQNGIVVTRSSSARIVGNTIRNNKLNGVIVNRASQADISSNTIDGNGRNGINVIQNSGVSLGTGTGTGIFDLPNSTGSNNSGVGIRCASNSSVDGRLGSLNGNKEAKDFDPSCVDSLKP